MATVPTPHGGVFEHRLRRKLSSACEGGRFIETVRDYGYLMRFAA